MSLQNIFHICVLLVVCLFNFGEADWLHELENDRTISVDNVKTIVNGTSYNSSHILRVLLDDLAFGKMAGKDGMQINLFTSNTDGSIEARGEATVFSVLLPLLIGFKIAGSILFTLVAVLVVSLKAFFASMISLVLTGTAAVKKMMMGHSSPSNIHYAAEFYPHYPSTAYDYPSATGYNAPEHPESSETGPSGSDHDEGIAAAESKTSAEFTTTVQDYSSAANTTATPVRYIPGIRRRIYNKQKNRITPLLTIIRRKEMTRKLNES